MDGQQQRTTLGMSSERTAVLLTSFVTPLYKVARINNRVYHSIRMQKKTYPRISCYGSQRVFILPSTAMALSKHLPSHQLLWFLASIYLNLPALSPKISFNRQTFFNSL